MQRIESRVNFEQAENAFAVLISLVQLDKGLVILAEDDDYQFKRLALCCSHTVVHSFVKFIQYL